MGDGNKGGTDLHRRAGLDVNLRDNAIAVCLHLVLHLHRLDDGDHRAGGDGLPGGDGEAHKRALDRAGGVRCSERNGHPGIGSRGGAAMDVRRSGWTAQAGELDPV